MSYTSLFKLSSFSLMAFALSACKTEPERPKDIEEPAAENSAAPASAPSPDVGTGNSAAGGTTTSPGTRADYQPTTGQGSQNETEPKDQPPQK